VGGGQFAEGMAGENKVKPLYALVAQHKDLERLDPEEVDEATLLATLEGLEGEIALKVESVAAYIRNAECFAEAVENAASAMKDRADRLNGKVEKLKTYLKTQMLILGQVKIQTPEFTIQIKKNPPSLIVDDIDKIPEKFKYQPLAPPMAVNKTALKFALENGEAVDGAHMHQGNRLVIKE
jgi:hypothetical protein